MTNPETDMPPIVEAFYAIAELAEALGVSDISQQPGCWEHQVDERWWFAVNAHPQDNRCSRGPEVPAFHAYVEFNGWPAGVFHPVAGGEFAAGTEANEDEFVRAAQAAIEKIRGAR